MKIHTSMTREQFVTAIDGLPPLRWHDWSEHGSRTHLRAFDFRLEGSGGRSNTGLYGAGDYSGATWDEWGAVIGNLFRIDPDARFGDTKNPVYDGAGDFHRATMGRFEEPGLPEDTHPRHRWESSGNGYFRCAKCSAEQANRSANPL